MAYDPKICREALNAQDGHSLSAIAADNNPNGNAYMGKLPNCDCPDCEPGAWPDNIQDQLDEFTENNGPGTVAIDE